MPALQHPILPEYSLCLIEIPFWALSNLYDNMLGAADGLKYFDLVEGKGPIAEKGSTVQVT